MDRNEIPKRSLEVIVKNDVSFFSRAKTTMGRVSHAFMLLGVILGIYLESMCETTLLYDPLSVNNIYNHNTLAFSKCI